MADASISEKELDVHWSLTKKKSTPPGTNINELLNTLDVLE